jgi:hypothetical protein
MPATLLATILLAAVPLVSMSQQQHSQADAPHEARMHEHMQQMMDRHLDHLAARLEIRASQQEAWKGFAAAVRGMVPAAPPEEPARDLDAATRARQAADRAADRAKRLAQLADATGKLQQVLDAPQKDVLNEVARELGHHMRERFGHHGDMHGGMHEEHEQHGSMHHDD